MKLVIYAGGIGTRLWPLSRENSPKQFDKIFSGKSTLQLAIERVAPVFGIENIFIQTLEKFADTIKDQIPELPKDNILVEPEKRNLAPAVCFSMIRLKKMGYAGPVALLWADHLMERVNEFTDALTIGEKLIDKNSDRFVFIGERSRFANNNLGWIKTGEKTGSIENNDYYEFAGWKYKPELEECARMHKNGDYFWNPGYFITSIDFLISCYKDLAPEIYERVATNRYGEAEATHFDRAIIEKVNLSNAVVLKTNMGWSDPGTLYALKEALEKSRAANVVQGKVSTLNTEDSLIYNLENNKLVTTVGLKGMVVVNTPDALVVVPKDEVVRVTELVDKLKKEGFNKYL